MNGPMMQTNTDIYNVSNMDSDKTHGSDILWPFSVQVVLAIFVGSTSFITVIANLIVIHAYVTTRALQTYTNIYIINLAVLDLIGGLFPMPMYGSYWVLGYWPLSLPMCDFYLWVNHVTLHATSNSVLIVAIDRYRSILHPIKHFQQRTRRHALLWISIGIISSLLLWTPTIFIWPAVGGRSFPLNICQPEYTNSFGFAAFAQLAVFWIPAIAMAVLYTKVYRVYKQRMGKKKYFQKEMTYAKTGEIDSGISSTKHTGSSVVSPDDISSTPATDNTSGREENEEEVTRKAIESPRVKKENNRAVRTLTLIFVVYLVSGVPWAVIVIVFKMCPTCIPLALYQASVYSARISSLLNPLCYAAANMLFRDAFKRAVCFWRR